MHNLLIKDLRNVAPLRQFGPPDRRWYFPVSYRERHLSLKCLCA
ncbi:MAG TPA: hypothetical protein VFG19_16705 [Geobacteraceae bacterium]|nr:hypothetical protein [Geobacteraceae bacterium]